MALTNLALVDQGKSLSSAVKGKASTIDYAHIIKLAYPSQENLITEEMPQTITPMSTTTRPTIHSDSGT